MVHKSKEAIKKITLAALQARAVLRIRRVEHAIKIPIAVCPPTHADSVEKGVEREEGRGGDSSSGLLLFRNVAACKIYC